METNPFTKTLNSIGEIGKDFTTSWGKRSDKAFDSWYGFANHFTFGAFDLGKDMWEGNQIRYEQMETPADVTNWLTMGGVDLAKGAINPDEALSKEHLLASFGITTMLAGGALKMSPGVKGSQPPKTTPTVKVPTKPPNIPVKKWATQLKPPVIKSVTNISEWFRVNFLNFPRREFAVDVPGGGNRPSYSRAEVDSNGGRGASQVVDDIIRDGSHMTEIGKLKPNIKYRAGEYEYLYKSDGLGRIKEFNANDLRLTGRKDRLPHKANTPGKESGDHAGHLAADRFGGSSELDNLISQSSSVNLSKYKKLENQWAKSIENGKEVSVNVKINCDGTILRPSSFDIIYKIDGIRFKSTINN